MSLRMGKVAAAATALLVGLFLVPEWAEAETRQVVFSKDAPPERHDSLIIGANIHYGTGLVYGYTSRDIAIDAIRDLGGNSFRDYFLWPAFRFDEEKRARLNPGSARRLFDLLAHSDLMPLLNVGYPTPHVPGGVPPVSDEALVYFRNYLTEAVRIMEPYRPMYEIWNEWNISANDGKPRRRLVGEGDPADPRAAVHYVRIAKTALATIHAADPDAKVLVGGVGDDLDDWAWTKAIVRGGVLDGAAGLSIHLYNHCMKPANRNARELIRRAEVLQDELKAMRGGAETPIYVTEVGWPTGGTTSCPVSEQVQAQNYAQFVLMAASVPWIRGIWMHSLKDVGPSPTDTEHHFGLFTYLDNAPKPGVCYFREAVDLVRQAESIEIKEPFSDVFVAMIRGKAGRKLVLWASSDAVSASYRLGAGAKNGRLICGATTVIPEAQPGQIVPQPIVFDLAGDEPVEIDIMR
ncbi:hypothetical protein [Xanthobacter autotrophicus]|uniref:hypothetical protein n=1 Tax=Xanthobacter autotrophicus TaxID=280 RepID=UPI003726C65B